MLSTSITEIARKLRREQTPSERLLWKHLRNRQLGGLKFLRQYPLIMDESESRKKFYVVDFYCAEKKLIIELDGPVHDYRIEKDADREHDIIELGYHILRIKNEELTDIKKVLDIILKFQV